MLKLISKLFTKLILGNVTQVNLESRSSYHEVVMQLTSKTLVRVKLKNLLSKIILDYISKLLPS